jgi:CxxC-x17-CxxC domain-containing protein
MAFRDRDNDREDSRGGFGRDRGSRGGGRSFGGNRGGSRGSFGGRDRGRSFGGNRGGGRSFGDRPRVEMHDAVCDSCKSQCQVPFRPSGDKPVLCSNCFEAQGNKHQDSGRRNGGSASVGGVSVAQFKELEAKVDKILYILENLAEDEEEEEPVEDEENEEEDEE